MDLNVSCCWEQLFLFSLLLVCVSGETSGLSFTVTFPAVIESGSEAKLCASFLKPNESCVMKIYLVHGDQSTLLLQEKAEEEFHRCFNFEAPLVATESVQRIKVELQGESFKMTEERKVMFRPYHPLTFIQTDKPIYIPGQTVNFRVVTMDKKFSPLNQQYSSVVLEDSKGNRIGQWTNVSSTRWILQRSYDLNPESRQGIYKLKAYIGDRMISHDFEVKKYVLPKFEVTVTAPKTSEMRSRHGGSLFTWLDLLPEKLNEETDLLMRKVKAHLLDKQESTKASRGEEGVWFEVEFITDPYSTLRQ